MNTELTKRQLQILRLMRDRYEELVDGLGVARVGAELTSHTVTLALLQAGAITITDTWGDCRRYSITETGRQMLKSAQKPCAHCKSKPALPDIELCEGCLLELAMKICADSPTLE
jgi:hypothetical protein